MASVLWEAGQWKFPHDFNPENFLDDQGEFVKPEAFVPFSLGEWTNQGSPWVRGQIRVLRG